MDVLAPTALTTTDPELLAAIQNEERRQRNKAVKSSLKTHIRSFRQAADSGDVDAATTAMRSACRALDKAASKGVIHKKQAANRKSAIAHRAAELEQS